MSLPLLLRVAVEDKERSSELLDLMMVCCLHKYLIWS